MAESNGTKQAREIIPGTRLVEYDRFYAHLDIPKRPDGNHGEAQAMALIQTAKEGQSGNSGADTRTPQPRVEFER